MNTLQQEVPASPTPLLQTQTRFIHSCHVLIYSVQNLALNMWCNALNYNLQVVPPGRAAGILILCERILLKNVNRLGKRPPPHPPPLEDTLFIGACGEKKITTLFGNRTAAIQPVARRVRFVCSGYSQMSTCQTMNIQTLNPPI